MFVVSDLAGGDLSVIPRAPLVLCSHRAAEWLPSPAVSGWALAPTNKGFFWHEQRKDLESQSSELLAKGAVSADHSTGRASSWEELELLLLCLGCSPLPAELSCCLRPNCLHQPEGVYHRQELSFLSLLTCIYQVIQTTPISVISSPRPLSGIVDNSSRLDSLYLFCVWKRKKSMKGSPGKNLGTQELY
jgi:hypothetical protein